MLKDDRDPKTEYSVKIFPCVRINGKTNILSWGLSYIVGGECLSWG